MTEQMAIIKDVGVGARDVGSPVLWFDVRGDGWGALQVFSLEDDIALELLSSVREVRQLEGKPCMVTREDNVVRFERLLGL